MSKDMAVPVSAGRVGGGGVPVGLGTRGLAGLSLEKGTALKLAGTSKAMAVPLRGEPSVCLSAELNGRLAGGAELGGAVLDGGDGARGESEGGSLEKGTALKLCGTSSPMAVTLRGLLAAGAGVEAAVDAGDRDAGDVAGAVGAAGGSDGGAPGAAAAKGIALKPAGMSMAIMVAKTLFFGVPARAGAGAGAGAGGGSDAGVGAGGGGAASPGLKGTSLRKGTAIGGRVASGAATA